VLLRSNSYESPTAKLTADDVAALANVREILNTKWTGGMNNATNLLCNNLDAVYTVDYTFLILNEGLIMADSGIFFFPLSPHMSIHPLYCALST
jgi:hypothetical protein